MINMNFDFGTWFEDTYGDQKDHATLRGYNLSYEEMRAGQKEAGWVVGEDMSVQINGAHIPSQMARKYLSAAPPYGKWRKIVRKLIGKMTLENIQSLNTYHTDTHGSWGLGQESLPYTYTYYEVLERAVELRAKVIVKTSKTTGNWYIKGTNTTKSYDDIKRHLEGNVATGYKAGSITRLISYDF